MRMPKNAAAIYTPNNRVVALCTMLKTCNSIVPLLYSPNMKAK